MRRIVCAMLALLGVWALGVAAGPAYATYPGPNGRIAFEIDRGAGLEIDTIRQNGTNLHRLLLSEAAESPDWSPDGRTIVFQIDHTSGIPECSIATMRRDGTHLRDLTGSVPGCDAYPSFTPDGESIVFVHEGAAGRWAVWQMDRNGEHRHRIRNGLRHHFVIDPNVSPDGHLIAFVVGEASGRNALFTVRMNGTHRRRIVPFRFLLGTHIDWAPNGKRILFTENRVGTANAATIRPDGTGFVDVTHYSGDVGAGGSTFSPDGRWIAFRLQNVATEKYWLARMRRDGSHKTRVVRMPTFGSTDWARRTG